MTEEKKKSTVREYAEALITAALVALVIRSFVFEAFKIPSASMIPTLSIGDHIFVNKFIYGLRIPLTKWKIVNFGMPKRGEVIVFAYPLDESKDYIKRTIGLPGDRIHIEEDQVIVNGVLLPRHQLSVMPDPQSERLLRIQNGTMQTIPFERGWEDFNLFEEQVGDVWHVAQYEVHSGRQRYDAVVPPGHVFVMGDNRDNSRDSREWGFVPLENIKGKAMFVWLSLDSDHGGIRWHEFGRWVK